MIHSLEGNLLEDTAEVYINTVNTVGVMGKGMTLPCSLSSYGRGNGTFADNFFRHVSCVYRVRTEKITPHELR